VTASTVPSSASGSRGADDVDPVEACFGVDLDLFALDGEAGIGDGDREVLGHLVLADDLAGFGADLGFSR
jgi:hypothetical protein